MREAERSGAQREASRLPCGVCTYLARARRVQGPILFAFMFIYTGHVSFLGPRILMSPFKYAFLSFSE